MLDVFIELFQKTPLFSGWFHKKKNIATIKPNLLEVPGGWNGQWLAAVTVLQMFLGGGGSFSTGGPGAEGDSKLGGGNSNIYYFHPYLGR